MLVDLESCIFSSMHADGIYAGTIKILLLKEILIIIIYI